MKKISKNKKPEYITKEYFTDTLTKALDKNKEDIILAVGKGFNGVYKRIDGVENSLTEKITSEIKGVEEKLGSKIDGLSRRIDDLVDKKVSHEQHKILADRVTRIEEKVGMKK